MRRPRWRRGEFPSPRARTREALCRVSRETLDVFLSRETSSVMHRASLSDSGIIEHGQPTRRLLSFRGRARTGRGPVPRTHGRTPATRRHGPKARPPSMRCEVSRRSRMRSGRRVGRGNEPATQRTMQDARRTQHRPEDCRGSRAIPRSRSPGCNRPMVREARGVIQGRWRHSRVRARATWTRHPPFAAERVGKSRTARARVPEPLRSLSIGRTTKGLVVLACARVRHGLVIADRAMCPLVSLRHSRTPPRKMNHPTNPRAKRSNQGRSGASCYRIFHVIRERLT